MAIPLQLYSLTGNKLATYISDKCLQQMETASRDFLGVDGSLLLPGGVRENCVGRAGLPPGGQLLTILLRNDCMEEKNVLAGN